MFREKLQANVLLRHFFLEVDWRHIQSFNAELAQAILQKPAEILLLFEIAATKAARNILFPLAGSDPARAEEAEREVPGVQVMIGTEQNMLKFRDLTVSLAVIIPVKQLLTPMCRQTTCPTSFAFLALSSGLPPLAHVQPNSTYNVAHVAMLNSCIHPVV